MAYLGRQAWYLGVEQSEANGVNNNLKCQSPVSGEIGKLTCEETGAGRGREIEKRANVDGVTMTQRHCVQTH